jgi:hypothetical protein
MCCLPLAFSRDLRLATIINTGGQRIKIYLYSECECLKNRSFFKNVVAAHIEGP